MKASSVFQADGTRRRVREDLVRTFMRASHAAVAPVKRIPHPHRRGKAAGTR